MTKNKVSPYLIHETFILSNNLILSMSLPEQKWWKRLFLKDDRLKKADFLIDIQAVQEFVDELPHDVKELKPLLNQLEELKKEHLIAKTSLVKVNLETQLSIVEKILERYEYFQNDADINGIRLRRLAQHLLKEAQKEGLNDLIKEKKLDQRWKSF